MKIFIVKIENNVYNQKPPIEEADIVEMLLKYFKSNEDDNPLEGENDYEVKVWEVTK